MTGKQKSTGTGKNKSVTKHNTRNIASFFSAKQKAQEQEQQISSPTHSHSGLCDPLPNTISAETESTSNNTIVTTHTYDNNNFDDLLDEDILGGTAHTNPATTTTSTSSSSSSFKQVEEKMMKKENDDFYRMLERLKRDAEERDRLRMEREERQKDIERERARMNSRSFAEVFEETAEDDDEDRLIKTTMKNFGEDGMVRFTNDELEFYWILFRDTDVTHNFCLFNGLPNIEPSDRDVQKYRLFDRLSLMNGHRFNKFELARIKFYLLSSNAVNIQQYAMELFYKSRTNVETINFNIEYQRMTDALSELAVVLSADTFIEHCRKYGGFNEVPSPGAPKSSRQLNPIIVNKLNDYFNYLLLLLNHTRGDEVPESCLIDIFILSLRRYVEEFDRCTMVYDPSKPSMAWDLCNAVMQNIASRESREEQDKLIFSLFRRFSTIYITTYTQHVGAQIEDQVAPSVCILLVLGLLGRIKENKTLRVKRSLVRLICFKVLRMSLLPNKEGSEFTSARTPQSKLLLMEDIVSDDPALESLRKLFERMIKEWAHFVRDSIDPVTKEENQLKDKHRQEATSEETAIEETDKLRSDPHVRREKVRIRKQNMRRSVEILSLIHLFISNSSVKDEKLVAQSLIPDPEQILSLLRLARDAVKGVSMVSLSALTLQACIVELESVIGINMPIQSDYHSLKQLKQRKIDELIKKVPDTSEDQDSNGYSSGYESEIL